MADMLEPLQIKRPNLELLDTFQRCLKSEVMPKKLLLVLDNIWEKEEERDKSNWKNVLTPLAFGSMGSKVSLTNQMDRPVALMTIKMTNKKKEILTLEGLEDDDCLQLLNNHAFANVEIHEIGKIQEKENKQHNANLLSDVRLKN
ncbi:hypothetical protein IEQ34_008415 [Dendrobium chrysotoxum]|uniref:NB-ARC domain-containing protein n=1 Tax=Dendrobium chrysotoxum TaxID=161865 RepID=A0AAV7GXQ2_DENCH|nr:hypothetical protein IEQ34_008415 [Dendrobium chrysotoxum]